MEDDYTQTIKDIPDDSSSPADLDDGLVSTVEFPEQTDTEPEVANNTEGETGEETAEETTEGNEETTEDTTEKSGTEETTRFDQHPRFQELIQKSNDYKTKTEELQARLDVLEAQKGEDVPDIMNMSDDDIQDALDTDPKGFLSNFEKHIENKIFSKQHELVSKEHDELLTARVNQTFEEFGKENDGFNKMWDSGELKAFMDAKPGHNAISAFQILTAEKRQQSAIDAAVSKAVKEAEKKFLTNMKNKGHAKSLESGPAATRPDGIDDELINPDKYGGENAVLTARFLKRQASG